MACMAALLISSGAAKSGKPCERFTAPYFIASRVISRITDSVNCCAFCETRLILPWAGMIMSQVLLQKFSLTLQLASGEDALTGRGDAANVKRDRYFNMAPG